MRKLLLSLCLGTALAVTACHTAGTYQTISATETIVLNANSAYLSAVVTGKARTNNVPQVEAAFNNTQAALRLAAVLASGGATAPTPAPVKAQATGFVTLVNTELKGSK